MKLAVLRPFESYTRWLHTRWPAGTVERLPVVGADGSTDVPGMYIVGDLTGIPLLKFSADTGARAVQTIAGDPSFSRRERAARGASVPALVYVGGGELRFYAAPQGGSGAVHSRRWTAMPQ